MADGIMIYLRDEDARILHMCEITGLIKNRSEFFRSSLYELAEAHGLPDALSQEIIDAEARLMELKALVEAHERYEDWRVATWQKIVNQFCARRNATRTHDLNWLRSRKRELKLCRPGVPLEDIQAELAIERERRSGNGKGETALSMLTMR